MMIHNRLFCQHHGHRHSDNKHDRIITVTIPGFHFMRTVMITMKIVDTMAVYTYLYNTLNCQP